VDGEEQADRQAHEQEHRVGVQLAYLQWVEVVARGVHVAGVRAGAGDHGADVEHHPGRRERDPGQHHRWTAGGLRGRLVDAA
jgi:hypothetical protein